jgi:hypothetical protein
MRIKPDDRTVKQLLASGYFRIPRFQRPYRWPRENVEEFWDDLVNEPCGEYFIGSLVVYTTKSRSDHYYIVDGQQRLTTIVLILCAVRDWFDKLGRNDLADGIQKTLLKPNIESREEYVLHPDSSYPYFHTYLLHRPSKEASEKEKQRPENRLLADAGEAIARKLREHLGDVSTPTRIRKGVTKLADIRDRVLSLRTIYIELDGEDEAYFVFETLNTRGMDLTASDLVKNYLLRDLRPEAKDVDLSKDKWEELSKLIEGSSARISVDSFLHHYWLSKYDYTSLKKLFKHVRQHIRTPEQRRHFLETLLPEARTYREINETDWRTWRSEELPIQSSLDALNDFKVKQDLPMLHAVMGAYREKKLKLKQVIRVLDAIEKFHFAFTAVTSSRSSGGISAMYASSARELTNAATPETRVATIGKLIAKLRERRPLYEEFEPEFVQIAFLSDYTKRKGLVQYVLARMHEYYAPSSGVATDRKRMTVEHIAPENPRRGEDRLRRPIVGSVGNLAWVSEDLQRKLGNKPPRQKLLILRKHKGIWLDEVLQTASGWTAAQVHKRAKLLAAKAYNDVWRF